jgi:NADPH2:quinone reductase
VARRGLQPGETVLVLGASGVVGQIGVQAAKLLGAGRVVAAARDPEGLERAGRLGADATVKLDASDDCRARCARRPAERATTSCSTRSGVTRCERRSRRRSRSPGS